MKKYTPSYSLANLMFALLVFSGSNYVWAGSDDVFRVMTLNVRIDKPTEYGLPGFDDRRSKIESILRHYKPDIIGLQEVEDKFWDKIKSDFSDYHSTFYRRGGCVGCPGHKEGVAILAKKSRFYYFLEKAEKTITRKDRAEAGSCPNSYDDKDHAYRNTVRVNSKIRITIEFLMYSTRILPRVIIVRKKEWRK